MTARRLIEVREELRDAAAVLCAAVLHHQFDQVLAAQPSLGDPECADVGRWRDQVLTAFRASRVGTCPLGSFVGQTDRDPLLHATLAALLARWQDALADLVRRAQAAGRVRADADPAQAGRYCSAPSRGERCWRTRGAVRHRRPARSTR